MEKYKIYHRDREYAYAIGDPVITTVFAESKQEAERKTNHFGPTGVWAVLTNQKQ